MWRKSVNNLPALTVKAFKGIVLIIMGIAGFLLYFLIIKIGVSYCMSVLGIPQRTGYQRIEQDELKMNNKQYDELLAIRAKKEKENEARWNALTPEEKAAKEAEDKRLMEELFDNVAREPNKPKWNSW
jgi:Na+-transporting methylmalonyl-CoA/oxaloacetate decarboxylase gamma subunit